MAIALGLVKIRMLAISGSAVCPVLKFHPVGLTFSVVYTSKYDTLLQTTSCEFTWDFFATDASKFLSELEIWGRAQREAARGVR